MSEARYNHHPLAGKLFSCLEPGSSRVMQVNCYDCGTFVLVVAQGVIGLRSYLNNWDNFYCPGCGRVSPMPQDDGKFRIAPEKNEVS